VKTIDDVFRFLQLAKDRGLPTMLKVTADGWELDSENGKVRGDTAESLSDFIPGSQSVSGRRKQGRPLDWGKRNHIVSLAKCNRTLSMAAIARHVGCSESLVAKVLREHGAEISEVHRDENHGVGGRRP